MQMTDPKKEDRFFSSSIIRSYTYRRYVWSHLMLRQDSWAGKKHVSLCTLRPNITQRPKCRFYFGCVSIYTITYPRNNYTHRHTQRPFLVLLWQRCLLLLATTNRPSESILTHRLGALQKKRKRRVKTDSATSSIDVCQLMADVLA